MTSSVVGTGASLINRIYAGIVDLLIFGALVLLLFSANREWMASRTLRLILIELIVGFWFVLASWWVTPGGWLYGLRLVDTMGHPPGMLPVVKRSLFPGSVWVAVLVVIGYREALTLDQQGAMRVLIGYLALSPIIWFCTTKLEDDVWSASNDRISGTKVMQARTNLWVAPLVGHWVGSSLRWAGSEVKSSLIALGEKILYGVTWLMEATEPLRLDARRAAAWLIDLGILFVAYLVLKDTKGMFSQDGSWYFLVVTFAVAIFIVMPAHGYSPGKRLMGLRIVDAWGNAPGYRAALKRTLIPGTLWLGLLLLAPQWSLLPPADGPKALLFLAFMVSAAFVFIDAIVYVDNPVFDSLHDEAARTYVIRHRPLARADDGVNAVEPAVRRPGRWPRLIGLLIDLALIVLCIGLNEALFPGSLHVDERYVGMCVIFFVYFVGFVAFGTTPGSWMAGTRIVDSVDGAAPGFRRAALRILPYGPGLVYMGFQTSPLAFHFEANERVKAIADVFVLALILAMALDLLTFLRGREPMHDQIAGTTVTDCAASSLRGRIDIWVRDKWRWITGVEPELTLIRPPKPR